MRIIGACFLALAAYVAADAVRSLMEGKRPEESPIGIIIAALSLVVMPLLAGAKRRVAAGLGSPALAADASSTSTEPDWSTGARLAADGHLDDVTVQAPCRHREAFLMIPGRFA